MAQHPHDDSGHAHVHGGITMGGKSSPDPLAEAHAAAGHPASHPTWKFYVLIGAVLTIITGVEVAIFYIPAMASVLVPTLLMLSIAKFVMVVMFYMHLRFDSPIFGRVFVAPLCLGMLVVVALIMLFKYIPHFEPWR